MKRRVFYSFHYDGDVDRAAQVRNIGVIEGNTPVTSNEWEEVKRGGDPAIERWISAQMKNRSCAIVLVGSKTAGRKWITHEIIESWNKGMGVLGIKIHNLKNLKGAQSTSGSNPFAYASINNGQKRLSTIIQLHSNSSTNSKTVYNWIADNIEDWIEEAIKLRNNY